MTLKALFTTFVVKQNFGTIKKLESKKIGDVLEPLFELLNILDRQNLDISIKSGW
jgi:hypothetical protein